MFKVNDAVRWTSSNTPKEGVVVAVVPAERMPRDVGFSVGDTSLHRNHESYIVRGGARGQRQTLYWPLVSLLNAAEGLTVGEISWCHANAARIREMIAATHNAISAVS